MKHSRTAVRRLLAFSAAAAAALCLSACSTPSAPEAGQQAAAAVPLAAADTPAQDSISEKAQTLAPDTDNDVPEADGIAAADGMAGSTGAAAGGDESRVHSNAEGHSSAAGDGSDGGSNSLAADGSDVGSNSLTAIKNASAKGAPAQGGQASDEQTAGGQAADEQTAAAQPGDGQTAAAQPGDGQTAAAQSGNGQTATSQNGDSEATVRAFSTTSGSQQSSGSAFDNLAVANVNGALNLRAQPSTESEVLGTCYRGGGGRILERKDGWTRIRSGSLEGWLKDDYLVFGQDIQPLAKELGLFTARITTQTLNVREEPTTDSAIVALAAGDDYYPVLSQENGWAKIQISADTDGYISCDYASIQVSPGKAVSIADELAALEKAEAEKKAKEEKKKAAEKPAYVISASDEDIYLMAACLMMEADGSYEGQLAVGNVIVNRVKSGQWGSSIPDVIYAAGQFPGATSGLLDKYISRGPSSSALKAARAALSGTNQIGNYLYFTSTKSANYDNYSDYTVVGGNCFYKK